MKISHRFFPLQNLQQKDSSKKDIDVKMSKKSIHRLPERKSPAMIVLKVIMLAMSLYYSLAMTALSGAGLIRNRVSYGAELEKTGIFLIISAILMTAGAILCLFRKDLPDIASIALSLCGFALCMIMLKRLTAHADSSGWTDKYTLQPISDMYRARIMPCIIPAALSVIIAAAQLCSYELAQQRRSARARQQAKKNAPAPSVLDDEEKT